MNKNTKKPVKKSVKKTQNTKSKKTINKSNISKKTNVVVTDNNTSPRRKRNKFVLLISLLFLSVLLIFSTYAWFSVTLNVKIKTFDMVVSKNAGLEISFDAVNYAEVLEISEDILFGEVAVNYPDHKSFWVINGLVPVSTIGNKSRDSYFFDIYRGSGIKYHDIITREDPYMQTKFFPQNKPRRTEFIAFDLFFKNDNNNSPTPDNLYFDGGTAVKWAEDISQQMMGLVNSIRIGIVKVGSLPIDAPARDVQNIQCNNNCKSIIYEPNSTNHTQMAIDKAKEYNITLVDGERFPTYANIRAIKEIDLEDTLPGSPNLDPNLFALQHTITEEDFGKPLFEIPHGVTKTRIYVWIEGTDIDSIETDSEGAEISLSLSFSKDTYGWDSYD